MIEPRECTFKVAMDKEQAELENHREVKLVVNFPEDCLETLVADAMKSQVIKWQGQIRKNWSKFEKDGTPDEITYGEALYESRKGRVIVRKPTEEEVEDFMTAKIAKLSKLGIEYLVKTGSLPSDENDEYWK